MNGPRPAPTWLPAVGCLSILAALSLTCLMPFLLVDVMQSALLRLHLTPAGATLAVFGIFLGGLINVPIHRIERHEPQPVELMGAFGLWGFTPRFQRMRQDTIIAVNVGGCLVPAGLAVWQIVCFADVGGWPWTALGLVVLANVAVCYAAARPVQGVGIMLPGFMSPLVSVGVTWLLLAPPEYVPQRAGVAFVAGVVGPLVGADLFHLRDVTRFSIGVLSIGGAGTFDGIVLSGVLAALLA
jgi:uncharacterized membrane protein